jgi:hypothetical protein
MDARLTLVHLQAENHPSRDILMLEMTGLTDLFCLIEMTEPLSTGTGPKNTGSSRSEPEMKHPASQRSC